jgi:serine/threonine protein kinase
MDDPTVLFRGATEPGEPGVMERLQDDEARARPTPERLGEYRIIRELGRGGMGIVYEAEQESLGRYVAVKAIHHIQMNSKRLQRFQLESQAIARLHHTNIVPIFGVGEHEGQPYYAMQCIRGNGLDVLIDQWRRGDVPPALERWRSIAGYGVQAAEALHYAHEQGVLHRDVKPANLLIDENQALWITDFGLAKLVGGEDLTASGDVIGTLRYLAPEALRGLSDVRSDVYSLGLTLYELITLEPPFGELSAGELLRQVSEGEIPLPRRIEPSVPRDLETIVLKAIAREPDHRYRSAHALADDLRRFLEDRPIRARRVTAIERGWRWSRRNRAVAALMATVAASLILAAGVGWIGYATTTKALAESRAATLHSESNVALSFEVFGDLFEKLAPSGQVSLPPLGMLGRHSPGPPADPADLTSAPAGPQSNSSEANTLLLGSVLTFYDRFARQNAENQNPRIQGEAAWAYQRVGTLYQNLGRHADAEDAYARAISMFEALIARNPADTDTRFKLVATCLISAPWSTKPGSGGPTEQRLLRARDLIATLVQESPDDADYLKARLEVEAKLGATLQGLGRPQEAESHYRDGIKIAGSLVEKSPEFAPWRLDRSAILEALAELEIAENRRGEALKTLAEATADMQSLRSQPELAKPLSDHFNKLSTMYGMLDDPKLAKEMDDIADDLD